MRGTRNAKTPIKEKELILVFVRIIMECTNQGLGIGRRRFVEGTEHTLDSGSSYFTVHIH